MISNVIRTCFPVAALAVADKQKRSKLNVFPVPDGDTGTNMFLPWVPLFVRFKIFLKMQVCWILQRQYSRLSDGRSRGNSGVITSQILRLVSLRVFVTLRILRQ